MTSGRLAIGLAALAPLVATQTALAAVPKVSMRMEACEGSLQGDVRRILAIELRSEVVDEADTPRSDTTQARVVCRDLLVDVSIVDPLTGKRLARTLSLEGTASIARARLLALAVAELVVASWSELETNPEPEVPPAGPAPPPAAKRAAVAVVRNRTPVLSESRWRLGAVLEARTFFANAGLGAGGGLRLRRSLSSRIGAEVDALVHHGSTERAVGDVAVDTLGGSMAVAATTPVGRFDAAVALGLRAAVGRLDGAPRGQRSEGRTLTGPVGGPFARAELAYGRGRGLVLALGVEAGFAVFSLQGRVVGDRDVDLEGLWLSMGVGVGFGG